MADALRRLFPSVKLAIGPHTETGFYYDVDLDQQLTEDDLARVEAEMRKIVEADLPFQRVEVERDAALALFRERGERYKVEILEGIPPGEPVTYYQHGDFVDMCRGPHVARTSAVKAFKLTSTAGAYWRGDERNKMLQRIYGTSFPSQDELDRYLTQLEEAKKRDHRKLGKELELFSVEETVGPGLILWHPRGAQTRYLMEEFTRQAHLKNGYELVFTPHVARDTLWKISGHLENFSENMFAGMEIEGQKYLVKPMNCPLHITIYKSRLRSYRELPVRLAELGTVYRYERSGVLGGLLRVRGFTQDDAHLFCTPDQMEGELHKALGLCRRVLEAFGFTDFQLYFSTRPKSKFAGTVELWDQSEAALRRVLEASGLPFEVDEGGGAFYGPKIDLKLRDAIGRQWQCSTIQLDYNLPQRFELEFVGADGARHRPIMIHRAFYGSVERFFAVLLEHYGGAFPTWLAPVQVRVLAISEKQADYGQAVVNELRAAGLRAELDGSADKIGAKIRRAQVEKVPYMAVIGDKEMVGGLIAPRRRDGHQIEPLSTAQFISQIASEAAMPLSAVS
jgi:threonyl-tRNA synthetase